MFALGLQSIYTQYVSLPSPAEKVAVKSQFYDFANFTGVIGLVDGTHVRIQRPIENEADYVNRHFYHSINVQAMCLPDGRFCDVLAKFPGSVHDSRIWKLSCVGSYVENHFMVGEHILGDSGYMLKTCLLTPYRQLTTSAQENYNYAHKKTRVLIEQTFERWKRRFHCFYGEIRMAPDKVCTIIVACAVLHNMANIWRQPMLEEPSLDIENLYTSLAPEEVGHLAAKHYRDQFTIQNFN